MLNLSQEQLDQLSGLTVEELENFWKIWPELSFEAAVGGAVGIKNGQGQERTERLSDEEFQPSEDFTAASSLKD